MKGIVILLGLSCILRSSGAGDFKPSAPDPLSPKEDSSGSQKNTQQPFTSSTVNSVKAESKNEAHTANNPNKSWFRFHHQLPYIPPVYVPNNYQKSSFNKFPLSHVLSPYFRHSYPPIYSGPLLYLNSNGSSQGKQLQSIARTSRIPRKLAEFFSKHGSASNIHEMYMKHDASLAQRSEENNRQGKQQEPPDDVATSLIRKSRRIVIPEGSDSPATESKPTKSVGQKITYFPPEISLPPQADGGSPFPKIALVPSAIRDDLLKPIIPNARQPDLDSSRSIFENANSRLHNTRNPYRIYVPGLTPTVIRLETIVTKQSPLQNSQGSEILSHVPPKQEFENINPAPVSKPSVFAQDHPQSSAEGSKESTIRIPPTDMVHKHVKLSYDENVPSLPRIPGYVAPEQASNYMQPGSDFTPSSKPKTDPQNLKAHITGQRHDKTSLLHSIPNQSSELLNKEYLALEHVGDICANGCDGVQGDALRTKHLDDSQRNQVTINHSHGTLAHEFKGLRQDHVAISHDNGEHTANKHPAVHRDISQTSGPTQHHVRPSAPDTEKIFASRHNLYQPISIPKRDYDKNVQNQDHGSLQNKFIVPSREHIVPKQTFQAPTQEYSVPQSVHKTSIHVNHDPSGRKYQTPGQTFKPPTREYSNRQVNHEKPKDALVNLKIAQNEPSEHSEHSKQRHDLSIQENEYDDYIFPSSQQYDDHRHDGSFPEYGTPREQDFETPVQDYDTSQILLLSPGQHFEEPPHTLSEVGHGTSDHGAGSSDDRSHHSVSCFQNDLDPDGDCIQGEAVKDYPNFITVQKTFFSCIGRDPGIYADEEARCQVWHYCLADGRKESFICPVGTIFSQRLFTCDWWYNVKCSNTESFYYLNKEIYEKYTLHRGNSQVDEGSAPETFFESPSQLLPDPYGVS